MWLKQPGVLAASGCFEKMKGREMEKKKKGYAIAGGIFLIAFIIFTIVLIQRYIEQKQADEHYKELAENTEKVTEQAKETEETDILAKRGIQIPEKNINWTSLKEENEDIYAWIYIPETNIDYPILQHSTELSYYLNHNLDGSEGYPGCIYTQNLNSKDFTDPNTVIYGHNMKNGTMFQNLHLYEDATFFEENRYVFIYTPKQVYVYEIFAAYEGSDVHLLYNFDFETASSFQMYLDSVRNVRDMNSHIKEDVEVTSKNHIITLSTCISNKPKNRYLVQAVLINDPMLE